MPAVNTLPGFVRALSALFAVMMSVQRRLSRLELPSL